MMGSKGSGRSHKARVLVVDDHALVRYGLRLLIESQPDLEFCGEVETIAQAREAVRRQNPDLVTVDLSLPDGSGVELVKQLRVERPGLAVLVISIHDETVHAELALRAGARGYLMKGEPVTRVLAAIRQVLGGKVYLSEAVLQRLAEQRMAGGRVAALAPLDLLGAREREVLELLGRGSKTSEIAQMLHVSVKTVEWYREQLKQKLGLESGAQLVRFAVEWVLQEAVPGTSMRPERGVAGRRSDRLRKEVA